MDPQQLLEQVWGYDLADPRVVTVHIGNLRKKLADAVLESIGSHGEKRQDFIQTVRGVGYRFAGPSEGSGRRSGCAQGHRARGRSDSPAVAPLWAGSARWRLTGASPPPSKGASPSCRPGRGSRYRQDQARRGVLRACSRSGRDRTIRKVPRQARRSRVRTVEADPFNRLGGRDIQRRGELRKRHCASDEAESPFSSVPEDHPPAGHRPTPRESQFARLRLLDGITAALKQGWRTRPACLVLDNLHLADASTLGVLHHVIRHLGDVPLMLLLTHRPIGPGKSPILTDIIAEIAHNDWGSILPLAPLTPADVELYVRELGAADAGARASEGLCFDPRTDRGQPPLVTQLLRLLLIRAGDPDLRVADLDLAREEGVRSVILQSLRVCRRRAGSG